MKLLLQFVLLFNKHLFLFFFIKTYPPAPITTTSYSCSTTGYLLPEAAVVSGRATLEDLTHLDVARRDCKSIRNFSFEVGNELI